MVKRQLVKRGIVDDATLNAMRTVPRESFVPADVASSAYKDGPLPIDAGQTISQPYIVALMVEALKLKPTDRVLEVGAGSGYATAVLSRIVEHVYAVERHGVLADTARDRVAELGYDNISVMHGDGTRGWAEHAPFGAIMVSAGGSNVPDQLLRQLAIGGRLVIPVSPAPDMPQELFRIERRGGDDYAHESLGQVRFVPLIGTEE